MTKDELEEFIYELDKASEYMCVFPEKMTEDCEDCYICRVDYFDWVRADMIEKFGLED